MSSDLQCYVLLSKSSGRLECDAVVYRAAVVQTPTGPVHRYTDIKYYTTKPLP